MEMRMMRGVQFMALAMVAATALASCGGASAQTAPKGAKNKLPPIGDSAAPDKALYDRAIVDIRHKKYETARLELNALINTYPETEYLAKAKMGIADSFYKEGGTGNLAQAVSQYKDFITFFPFLPEASYAQMQVAMVHFRQLTKPDRDRTEAEMAEQEFQIFLKNYPDNELAPVAAQHLREVQEDLAEGDFRIASYYYKRKSNKAAAGRLQEIADRYPLFSKADEVLLMLGTIAENAPSGNLQGQQKELFITARKNSATHYFSMVVQNYPLSPLVPKAKEELTKLGAPIPQPDPAALARMQQEQAIGRKREGPLSHVTGVIHSGPDVTMASRVGTPNLNPPDDSGGGSETLNAALTNLDVTGRAVNSGSSAGGRVETGEGGAIQPGGGSNVKPMVGSENNRPITGSTTSNSATSNATTNTSTNAASNQPAKTTPASGTPQPGAATNTSTTGASSSKNAPAAGTQAKPCGPDTKDSKDNKQGSSSSSSSDSKDKKKKPDCNSDESSSKKKTGIHKIIPW